MEAAAPRLPGVRPREAHPRGEGGHGSLTIILPGPVTFDGATYRTFRPYARLANALLGHFERVIVSTQVLGPSNAGFVTNDAALDPRIEIHGLPEPPAHGAGIGSNLRYQWRRMRAVLRQMRRWEMIYAFLPSYPGAIAYTVNRLTRRRPMAVYIGNDWEEITPYTFRWQGWRRRLAFPAYRFLLARWERWIMRTTPLAITAGRALLAKYGGPGRPVYETVPLLEMGVEDLRERRDTCTGDLVRLLFVGSLSTRKGLPILFDAVRALRAAGRSVRLDLVGEGPERTALADAALRLGIADDLHFHGFVPHGERLFGFYREADVFVLPTYSEGFPRVLYEALGQSLPIVASAVSGIPHLLEHERHALLVPPGEATALTNALARVMDDGELRRKLLGEGFALVRPIVERDAAEQFVDLFRHHLISDSTPAAVQ